MKTGYFPYSCIFLLPFSFGALAAGGSLFGNNNAAANGGDAVYKCDPCNFETKYSGNLKEHFKTKKHLRNTKGN